MLKQVEVGYCETCCKAFKKTFKGQRFCSEQCSGSCDEEGTAYQGRKPVGRYIYAWYRNGENLPFYIGKGIGDRAWRHHDNGDGSAPAACQVIRSSSKRFEVRILRENLTQEGALLCESLLLDFLTEQCGITLANQHGGTQRQERPPLELPLNLDLTNHNLPS